MSQLRINSSVIAPFSITSMKNCFSPHHIIYGTVCRTQSRSLVSFARLFSEMPLPCSFLFPLSFYYMIFIHPLVAPYFVLRVSLRN